MPRSRALILLAGGERFSAEDAQRWGLVDELAEKGHALESALQLAETISGNSALAVRTIKAMVDAPRRDDDDDLDLEAQLFSRAWMSDEHWDALASRHPTAKSD